MIEMVVFGESLSIISFLTTMVYIPMVYDYVRRNKMGTYNAGAQMVTKLTTLITLNGVGLFVWGYAALFQPPAGEMTRVVLRSEQIAKAEVVSALRSAAWTAPQGGAPGNPADVAANAWQATGVVADTGRCWEVHFRNPNSKDLAAEKENLQKENSPLIAEEKSLRDKAAALQRGNQPDAALREEEAAGKKKARIDQITGRIAEIDATLKTRAESFQGQVARVLGNRLLTDGEQVLGASLKQALLVSLPAVQRPDPSVLEKMLDALRRERPGMIDLRPLKRETGYGVTASVLLEPGADETGVARDLQNAVERAAASRAPRLFAPGTAPLGCTREPAVTLNLMTIEEPIETYVSPVTRVVNGVLGLFDRAPSPARRLAATARNLRSLTETNHVRADRGAASKTIVLTAVLPETASKASILDDPVGRKLRALLRGSPAAHEALPRVRAFYDRAEKAAATQRLTIARPLLTSAYAPMKYDYMSGYLWMFFMGLIGITITIVFNRFEAKGLIHKRGVEEAQAS
ncbi:MAG: hypothetical protein PHQ12_00700 [Chthoniobacteraceae bacterium]|nr:hypothetical protein [Chthoniobacteraceae bacterium]